MEQIPEIPSYSFVQDMPEGKEYFCDPEASIIIFKDLNKALINPFGAISLKYDSERNFVCPIIRTDGKISMVTSQNYKHTPYHSSQKNIQRIGRGWLDCDIICKDVDGTEDNSMDIPYHSMDIMALENILCDWLEVINKEGETSAKIEDVKLIKKLLLEKIEEEKNKQLLLDLWNNLELTIDDPLDDEFSMKVVQEIQKTTQQRLVKLGSRKKVKRALKDMDNDELESLLAEATEKENYDGPDGAIAIKKEIESRKN